MFNGELSGKMRLQYSLQHPPLRHWDRTGDFIDLKSTDDLYICSYKKHKILNATCSFVVDTNKLYKFVDTEQYNRDDITQKGNNELYIFLAL